MREIEALLNIPLTLAVANEQRAEREADFEQVKQKVIKIHD